MNDYYVPGYDRYTGCFLTCKTGMIAMPPLLTSQEGVKVMATVDMKWHVVNWKTMSMRSSANVGHRNRK